MSILFAFPGHETFSNKLELQTGFLHGDLSIKYFPDGESLVTIQSEVKNHEVILVCNLDRADEKMMPLLCFVKTAKALGAKKVTLVAPYLGYMRQDKRFHPGEAISSVIFADFLSTFVDHIITLDPHLHRHSSLDKLYAIPTTTLHAAPSIAEWIRDNIKNPLIIGPDQESKQWVQAIAQQAKVPFITAKKVRHSDTNVTITLPDLTRYKEETPVLVDDIISTATTMIETIKTMEARRPICIGIHAIFANNAYSELTKAGAAQIVTTNALAHETNKIDITPLFANAL